MTHPYPCRLARALYILLVTIALYAAHSHPATYRVHHRPPATATATVRTASSAMGTTAAHRRRPGSIVVLSPSAVALALLFLSTTLRLAAAVQPYGGGGGPCALAVSPLGYPCEEHQVRSPCFVLLALTLDMTN